MKPKGGSQKPRKTPNLSRGKIVKGSPEYKLRLEKIAFKPWQKTWEELAKEEGIALDSLFDFRQNHAEEIEELQRDKFVSARADVEQALIGRATTGWDNGKVVLPPDPKMVQLFIDRFSQLQPKGTEIPVDVLAGYYPLQKQVLPLFHWDRAFAGNGQDQIIGVMAGRGFGKSILMVRKALNLAKINRGCEGMILAPTYKMLANPIRQYWEDTLRLARVPYKHHKTDNFYELWGDTKIWFRSYDNVDTSGRGPTLAWLLCDEFREGSKYIFDTLIASVREPNAKLRQTCLFSTPNGYDHMYEILADPDSKLVQSGRSVLYNGTTYDNVFLPLTFGTVLEESYDDQVVKQEVLGQFIPVSQGQIYYQFDRNIHVGEYPFDPALPIWIGVDFNFNPLCAVVGQPHGSNGRTEVWIVDEVRIEGAATPELAQELKRRGYDPNHYNPEHIEVFPDASGSQKSAVAGALSNIQILKDAGFSNLSYPRANSLLLDRYASVNGMLRNSKGDIRLKFNKSCRYLIKDMEQDVYKVGSNIRDNSSEEAKKRGHLADALGYMIHRNFRVESSFNYEYRY